MNKEVYMMMLYELKRVRGILEEEGARIEKFFYEAIKILEISSCYSKELSKIDRDYSCYRENRYVLLEMICGLENEFEEIIHNLP